jgi:hypothetical protein
MGGEHVNKTGLMLQLNTQIHEVPSSQIDLATKECQPRKLHIQFTLEKLRNGLSTEMSNQKFKLERSPKISVKRYSTS